MVIPGLRSLTHKLLSPSENSNLSVEALGLRFPSPVGLAAGFDKNAQGYDALGALGFGFIEIGTVTGRPQPGNPKPRMFRLTKDRALINRMGFNNDGSFSVAQRLKRRRRNRVIVGVNIGKTKHVSEENAEKDYKLSATRLAPYADYMVVNVSSPNTPGLRNLQAVDRLRPLLATVREALDVTVPTRRVPLLVKISPDLSDDDVDAVAQLALSLQLDGIIATNTTTSRKGLMSSKDTVSALGAGGLSGAPLKVRSLQVLKRLRKIVGSEMVLISAGGIENGQEVHQRLKAGATLVQAYSAFVYGGPLWPWKVNRDLENRL